ncbi:glycosyltransferase family 4 protein [Bythopirellula goksoeyrii]|uniref:Mannosylfructose-phosphate synthase n=1 Tax=Bythopirellula goksoeyrii TaxID=1400387 RepID=A0A5B9Q6Q6_9BACT|nr:glycosyltransferase family 4 protein [Bythopirellula goksoeyrii]QEG34698.1 Mannosylfructose-phosphate synthase [Bythopirellula goksoeyrii]
MTNTRVKLAIVSNVIAPYRASQHLRIARELGEKVELWSLVLFEHDWQPWQREFPPEIRPVVFGKGEVLQSKHLHPLRQWLKMGEVIRFLQDKQIDMVITTGANDLGLLRLIRWCSKNCIPNFLFGDSNVLGDKADGIRGYLKQLFVGYAVKHVTGLLPCGVRGKQFFERYGGAHKPVFFLPHEPNYDRIFSISIDQCLAVQAKYGLQSDRNYFIYSGRLVSVKGVDTLIAAFIRIALDRPDWDLLVVGGGELEAELKARVPANLKNRIVWTGFVSDQEELFALYHSAEVFVLPSRFEPWAVVVCEAAAAGLAILTSEMVGAGTELCREGYNGAVFPAGDVNNLSDKLLWVTEDDERLAELQCNTLQALDDWRRRGDPVQGVRLAMSEVGLLECPKPVEPNPPTPLERSLESCTYKSV